VKDITSISGDANVEDLVLQSKDITEEEIDVNFGKKEKKKREKIKKLMNSDFVLESKKKKRWK
jgi:hypothetical protein